MASADTPAGEVPASFTAHDSLAAQAVIRRAAKRLGIEPPGGGRGKSRKSTARGAGTTTGGRKRRLGEAQAASAPSAGDGGGTAAQPPTSTLDILHRAYELCAVLVEERAADSHLAFGGAGGRNSKVGRRDQLHSAASGALSLQQLMHLRTSFVECVARAAQYMQRAAFCLGQASGHAPLPHSATVPSAITQYVIAGHRRSAVAQVPAHGGAPPHSGSRAEGGLGRGSGMPLGHQGLAQATGVSGEPAQGVSLPHPLQSTKLPAPPSSRASVAQTAGWMAGGASTAAASDALSKFAAVAAEAWERESATSNLSGAMAGAPTSRGRQRGGRQSSRHALGRGFSPPPPGAVSPSLGSGEGSNISGGLTARSRSMSRGGKSGGRGGATPLSPAPHEEAEGVSGPPAPLPQRKRGGSMGGASDADSTRAAPAAGLAGLQAALGVAFAAEDEGDRFDPFDFIEAADLRGRRGADSVSVGLPAVASAPVPAAKHRHRPTASAASPVVFGIADTPRASAPPGMLPHQLAGKAPGVPGEGGAGHAALPGSSHDGGTVGAAAAEYARAGSALSSLGRPGAGDVMGTGGPPLSIASSGGGGLHPFPSPGLGSASHVRGGSVDSGLLGEGGGPGLSLGGDVMGLAPPDTVSHITSPAAATLRPRPLLAPPSAGHLGSGSAGGGVSSGEVGHTPLGGWAGASLEGLYGYTAWGAGVTMPAGASPNPDPHAPQRGRRPSTGSGHGFSSGDAVGAAGGPLAQLTDEVAGSREW